MAQNKSSGRHASGGVRPDDRGSNAPAKATAAADSRGAAKSPEREEIEKWLKQVRFKKAVLGGLNEADVWKKLAELNGLYEQELKAERARYDALLDERLRGAVQQAARLMAARGMRVNTQAPADEDELPELDPDGPGSGAERPGNGEED